MHPFEYVRPRTLEDALGLLAEHGAEARVLAGGQSLIPLLNYRLARPRVVVDITGVGLDGIAAGADGLRLGALARHHTLEESAVVGRHAPVLAEAARLVGNVRVRSLGTVGGSLAHADPAAELPMVMLALDGRLTARSARGSRRLEARELITGYLTTSLEPGEVLTEVHVPALGGRGTAIEEMARRVGDFAVVAVTAVLGVDRQGRVDDVRLAYAGVGPTPVRAAAAEEVLRGHEPTAERLGAAARAARTAVRPHGDPFASAAYRGLLVEVLTRRALARATARALEVA